MHAEIAFNSQHQSHAVKSLWSHYCERLAEPKRPALIQCPGGPAVGRREALMIWAALAPEASAPLWINPIRTIYSVFNPLTSQPPAYIISPP